jgi:hypothetical protein
MGVTAVPVAVAVLIRTAHLWLAVALLFSQRKAITGTHPVVLMAVAVEVQAVLVDRVRVRVEQVRPTVLLAHQQRMQQAVPRLVLV